jgi:hypothetical protein
VFENRVLRKIFGVKNDEVTGERRRLRKEQLCDLYLIPNIIPVIKEKRTRYRGTWHIWGAAEVYRGFGGET